MAAKILQSLTDDNPDLQNQIGCMTGIFQIFDRQHVITPRRLTGHRSNRHPTDSAFETESNSIYNKSMPMEKHSRRHVLEKQRVSTESSRASFSSSSRSSSFSSLDLNKNVQQDSSSSLDRITFPENPPKHAGMNQSSVSPQLGRQSLDLREVVKESMYRESQTLSVKTTSMEEIVKKSFTSPWLVEEPRELSRSASYHVKEGSFFSIPKEGPRFSYDGKDTRHVLFDTRDNSKSSMKPPRLSLDSRESSTRSLMSETSGTQTRPSSVVAKLMGLEAMPSESKTSLVQDCNVVYRSSKTSEPSKPIQISIPSKTSYKEPNSPRWKVPDSSVKPVSRFPMEPAPWKQVDGNRISTKASIKGMKAPVRNSSTFPTVFSEIEKRLKDLEFSQSGKDLRALKQILEAMQAKGLLENQNGENTRKNSNSTALGDSRKPQNDQVSKRSTNISRDHESPIVVVKSAKMIEKSGIPPSSVISLDEIPSISRIQRGAFVDNNRGFRFQTVKSSNRDRVPDDVKSINRTSRTTQASSSRSLQNAKEGSSNTISPRLHNKKKQELEKRSKPPIHPSESIKSRKPANKQVTDSSSPGGRRRLKISNIQQNDEPSSDYSAQSDGSILSESPMDIEVNSSVSCLVEKQSTLLRSEDESKVDHPPVAPEYRSPISVLDAVLDIDDSPSPVKNKQKTIRGEKSRGYESISCSDEHNPESSSLTDPAGFIPMSEINRKKLQKIENLVQKLQRLNSTHDEAQTDYIASLCENTNPDHRYISEILLASGFLLSDLESSLTNFHFHASGHPINPELFLVLEQTAANNFMNNERDPEKTAQLRSKQKVHRKLIFDTVNEVLARKLAESGLSNKLARKNLNAQMLLRELCLETEELQSMISKCSSGDEDDVLRNTLYEDVMHQSESWTNHRSDVSGIILDIERLVFKDLVNEIVIGEAPCLENKPVRRRQLFKN